MLRAPGAPKLDRLLILALHASLSRTDTRRSLVMLTAIQDAFAGAIPLKYFQVICDDQEEATAMHNLHESRVEFLSRQPAQPVSEG